MNYDIDKLIYMLESGNVDPNLITALSGVTVISNIISIAISVLMIIAMWKLFTKAGEKGWKSIIPFYNQYILYKITWKKRWFWISLILDAIIIGLAFALTWDFVVYTAGAATGISEETFFTVVGTLAIAIMVLAIPVGIISIILCFKIAKSYGKGAGWGFGLLFFYPIFLCILAFGSAVYCGPEGKGAPAAASANSAYTPQPVAYAPVGTYQPASAQYPQQTQNYYAPTSYGQQTQTYTPQQTTYTPASTYAPVSTSAPVSESPLTPVTYTPGAVTYGTPSNTPKQ